MIEYPKLLSSARAIAVLMRLISQLNSLAYKALQMMRITP